MLLVAVNYPQRRCRVHVLPVSWLKIPSNSGPAKTFFGNTQLFSWAKTAWGALRRCSRTCQSGWWANWPALRTSSGWAWIGCSGRALASGWRLWLHVQVNPAPCWACYVEIDQVGFLHQWRCWCPTLRKVGKCCRFSDPESDDSVMVVRWVSRLINFAPKHLSD